MTDNDMSFRKDIPKFRSGLRIPFSGKKVTVKKVAASCSKPLVPMCQNTLHRIDVGSNIHSYCYANVESNYVCARFRRNTHYCSSMYSYCCLCILIVVYVFLDAATLTEIFPCFFFSCKANARV
jgi:hypothetical protein